MKQEAVNFTLGVGGPLPTRINDWLTEHPGWKVSHIMNYTYHGGTQVLVVFEEVDDK